MSLFTSVILGLCVVILSIHGTNCEEQRRLLLHSADDIALQLQNIKQEVETLKTDQAKEISMLKVNQSQEIALLKSNQSQEIESMKSIHSQEMVALRSEMATLKTNQTQEVIALKSEVVMLSQETATLKAEIMMLKSNQTRHFQVQTQDMTSLKTQLAERGSTYIRWGRTMCSGNGTQEVYSGCTAGSPYDVPGGAASFVCLPEHPTWAKYTDGLQDLGGYISGTEYHVFQNSFQPFPRQMNLEDAPCVLCHTPHSVSTMIPGRTDCYQGWTVQYTGYLMTGRKTQNAATDYACIDAKPEAVLHGEAAKNGKLLFFTEVKCGSLPCQEYPDGRELACVVCSK